MTAPRMQKTHLRFVQTVLTARDNQSDKLECSGQRGDQE